MSTNINIPKKLAIFYGWPSTVNSAGGDINLAVNVYKQYDQVVFGSGLEDSSHPDHANTQSIIQHVDMVNTDVFGYIDATLDLCALESKILDWKSMGVKGIFADQFGYDFGVTRCAQNHIVDFIHGEGLLAFVNAWDPDDVFSPDIDPVNNHLGKATTLNSNDYYLSESFQIINGGYQSAVDFQTKSDKMVNYNNIHGTNMACVTTYDNSVYDQDKMDYAYFSCVLYNFHSFGWGEEFFSSSSSSLPFRDRKTYYGTYYGGNIVSNGNVLERQSNVGVHVDLNNHTTSILLD